MTADKLITLDTVRPDQTLDVALGTDSRTSIRTLNSHIFDQRMHWK